MDAVDKIFNFGFSTYTRFTKNEDYATRICYVCLPFLEYYEPFNHLSNLVKQKTFTISCVFHSCKNFRLSISKDSSCDHSIKVIGNLALGILSMFSYRWAKIVYYGYEVSSNLKEAYKHANTGKRLKAYEAFCYAMAQSFELAFLVYPSNVDLKVCSLSITFLTKLEQAYAEWNKDRHIETIGNLALACIKVYKVYELEQIVQFRNKAIIILDSFHKDTYLPSRNNLVEFIGNKENLQKYPELHQATKEYMDVVDRIPSRDVTVNELVRVERNFDSQLALIK